MIEELKQLRATLIKSHEEISNDWMILAIDPNHYLADSLADLTIKLEQVKDLVNQGIGELT